MQECYKKILLIFFIFFMFVNVAYAEISIKTKNSYVLQYDDPFIDSQIINGKVIIKDDKLPIYVKDIFNPVKEYHPVHGMVTAIKNDKQIKKEIEYDFKPGMEIYVGSTSDVWVVKEENLVHWQEGNASAGEPKGEWIEATLLKCDAKGVNCSVSNDVVVFSDNKFGANVTSIGENDTSWFRYVINSSSELWNYADLDYAFSRYHLNFDGLSSLNRSKGEWEEEFTRVCKSINGTDIDGNPYTTSYCDGLIVDFISGEYIDPSITTDFVVGYEFPFSHYNTAEASMGELRLNNSLSGSGILTHPDDLEGNFYVNYTNVTSYTDFSIDKDVVGLWRFEEGSGTTIYGELNHNGIISGAVYNSTNPKLGQYSMTFDGIDDYIDFGDVDVVVGDTGFTLAVWLYPRNLDETITFISKAEGGSSGQAQIAARLITKKFQIIFSNGTNGNVFSGNTSFVANKWQFATATWDGTENADGVKFYYNGVPDGTATSIVDSIQDLSNALKIGYYDTVATQVQYWNGSLDSLMILNRSLTAGEVELLFNATNNTLHNLTSTSVDVRVSQADESVTAPTLNDSNLIFFVTANVSGVDYNSTSVRDAISGKNGTIKGSTQIGSDYGKIQDGINMIGNGQNVEFNEHFMTEPINNFSMSFWFRITEGLTESGNGIYPIQIRDSDDVQYYIVTGFRTGGIYQGFYIRFRNGTNTYDVVTDYDIQTSVFDNDWHNIVWSFQNSTETVQAYMDGITIIENGSVAGLNVNNNMTYLEEIIFGDFATIDYNGSIDEVRFYNKTLNQDDAWDIWQSTYSQYQNKPTYETDDSKINLTDLVAHWTFDRYSQNITHVYDIENENDLIKRNNTFCSGDGFIDVSCDFDGVSDYTETDGYIPAINATTALSVTSWVYWDDESGNEHDEIVSQFDTGSAVPKRAFRIFVGAGTNRYLYGSIQTDVGLIQETSGEDFDFGRWVHLAMTWDAVSDVMTVYKDGEVYFTKSGAGNTLAGINSDVVVRVGAGGDATGAPIYYWNGKIDQVMIFNRSLSADEVKTLFETSALAYGDFTTADTNPFGRFLQYNITINSHDQLFSEYVNGTITIADNTSLSGNTTNIIDIIPVNGTTYAVNTTIELSANVTATAGVSSVKVNLTMPDSTIIEVNLINSIGNKYNASYTLSCCEGQWNTTFIVTDNSGIITHANGYFIVSDTENPKVTNPQPDGNSYQFEENITISADVTDNGVLSTVTALITYPNSTTDLLTLYGSGTYSNTFITPILNGRYNISFNATDNSGNYNDTALSYFIVNDTYYDGYATLTITADSTKEVNQLINVNITTQSTGNIESASLYILTPSDCLIVSGSTSYNYGNLTNTTETAIHTYICQVAQLSNFTATLTYYNMTNSYQSEIQTAATFIYGTTSAGLLIQNAIDRFGEMFIIISFILLIMLIMLIVYFTNDPVFTFITGVLCIGVSISIFNNVITLLSNPFLIDIFGTILGGLGFLFVLLPSITYFENEFNG